MFLFYTRQIFIKKFLINNISLTRQALFMFLKIILKTPFVLIWELLIQLYLLFNIYQSSYPEKG